MARANDAALDTIDDVLAALRRVDGVIEKKCGVFYRGRDAFAHFHVEDGVVLADVKLIKGEGFARFALRTKPDRIALIRALMAL